jgi:hypothetical protein
MLSSAILAVTGQPLDSLAFVTTAFALLTMAIAITGLIWSFRNQRLAKTQVNILEARASQLAESPTFQEDVRLDLEAKRPAGQAQPKITFPGLMSTEYVGKETLQVIGNSVEGDNELQRLTRYWAIAFGFERAYRQIFGSQITLLQKANTLSVSRPAAEDLYKQSVSLGNKQTFEQWINFITKVNIFLNTEGDGYKISPIGRLFLLFLTTEGYPQQKYL